MLERSPIVVLVGGPSTGKTNFFRKFTGAFGSRPSIQCTPNPTMYPFASCVMIDTPGHKQYRNKFEYCWEGIFKHADIILNFGEWSESEIFGEKGSYNPKHMTWSGDNDETMKRIAEYLQEE